MFVVPSAASTRPSPPSGVPAASASRSSGVRHGGPAWAELADVTVGRPDEPHADVEVLIVANETVDEAVLEHLPALRLVANFGVGYDRVDLSLCRARDIAVTNTPGVLDAATADLAFALIL